ncbi:hypothetical protein DRE_04751 [Drechslerella stenobrocha 248]|uniref:Uncharacterized protein n=1 Tax=Drechslerella stenobrocha 248 TaxID=1043628 RepID=W7I182_9PEZI|nr:hypothetical protein DRE_04751 [Drechslerella stenobrocha 248]
MSTAASSASTSSRRSSFQTVEAFTPSASPSGSSISFELVDPPMLTQIPASPIVDVVSQPPPPLNTPAANNATITTAVSHSDTEPDTEPDMYTDADADTDPDTDHAYDAALRRIALLQQALRDGSVTANQTKNVQRVIADLHAGIAWALYQDGDHVTPSTCNFSRLLWREPAITSPPDAVAGGRRAS